MAGETVERIVAAAFEADVHSWYRPRSGSVGETVVCRLDGAVDERDGLPSRVVCKRGGASVWTGDVIEPDVLERIAEATDLPVPRVLATGSLEPEGAACSLVETDATGPLERWAIYEFRRGTNPGPRYPNLDPAARRRLVADAGEVLGRLHGTSALEFDRVGGVARSTGEYGAMGNGVRLCEPDGWHAVDPGRPLASLPVPLAGDEDCRPVLTHGDYQPSNLLVDGEGAVTAVLDWGNAHVTHAEYALARAEARFVDSYAGRLSRNERRRLRRLFRRAYASRVPLEAAFDRRAPIYKLLWLVQSGVNYLRIARSPRGRRQLWRQCRRLLE
ncbi:phosphotransferase family protein [Natronorubrum sp. FCH18a]|uniref:phosphotransferase family protein n=1 Tax=Natronorubrum sp. FCH18a TaxID=3447018 RepID=UPI003F510288